MALFSPRGSSARSYRQLAGNWGAFGVAVKASLTTALAGANNDITYTSKAADAYLATGNTTRIRYVVAGANTALSVSVSSADITVNVATDGSSAATSTATAVKNAVNAHAGASALVDAQLATGNDGTGVVTALAFTALTGGQDYVIATSR